MTKAIKAKRPIKVLIYGRDKQELADLTLLADGYVYVSVEGAYSDTIGAYSFAERIVSPVEEHSKKPDIVRDKIVQLAGNLPRVELFARQKVVGWDAWGNEVESDIEFN